MFVVVPLGSVIAPPIRAARICSAVGFEIPRFASERFASESASFTLPKPIGLVAGVNVAVLTLPFVVVVRWIVELLRNPPTSESEFDLPPAQVEKDEESLADSVDDVPRANAMGAAVSSIAAIAALNMCRVFMIESPPFRSSAPRISLESKRAADHSRMPTKEVEGRSAKSRKTVGRVREIRRSTPTSRRRCIQRKRDIVACTHLLDSPAGQRVFSPSSRCRFFLSFHQTYAKYPTHAPTKRKRKMTTERVFALSAGASAAGVWAYAEPTIKTG